MRYGFKHKLNIQDYSNNAAKNFSLTRIAIYTAISLILTILLGINLVQSNYQGKALLFTGVAFICILGYTLLNISALIKKIKD